MGAGFAWTFDQAFSPDPHEETVVRLDREDQVTVFYDVSATTDDINIQVSSDGETWRLTEHSVAPSDISTGGDTVSFATGFQWVRAYAKGGFDDADVNAIEADAKRRHASL